MKECYIGILKTLKVYPPAKNEYKFIYGKLIEKYIISAINKCITPDVCIDLDANISVGATYKFDCKYKIPYSIKASKNHSNSIIVVNKYHNLTHKLIDINYILCYILKGELYIFPHFIVPNTIIVDNGSNIHFKSKIYKEILQHSIYKYKFPEIDKKVLRSINEIEEVDIFTYLYEELNNLFI